MHPERLKLLDRNKHRIMAFYLMGMEPHERDALVFKLKRTDESCLYKYSYNGLICVASAALTKTERDRLAEICNQVAIDCVRRELLGDVSTEDITTLRRIQYLHDMCLNPESTGRQFSNFERAYDRLLETGELPKDSEEVQFSDIQYNRFFKEVDGTWVKDKDITFEGPEYV